jgi:hypothetical protein
MAGANNAALKSIGFRAREVTKIRAKYGAISSAKEAVLAANAAGVRIPPKLQARVEGYQSRLAQPTGIGLKNRAADIVAKRIEKGVSTDLKVGDKLGRRESTLAKKLTDRQVQIMSIAQREMASWQSTGRWDRNALKPHEWREAERLLESV